MLTRGLEFCLSVVACKGLLKEKVVFVDAFVYEFSVKVSRFPNLTIIFGLRAA